MSACEMFPELVVIYVRVCSELLQHAVEAMTWSRPLLQALRSSSLAILCVLTRGIDYDAQDVVSELFFISTQVNFHLPQPFCSIFTFAAT